MAGREEGLVEEAIFVVSLLLLKASQAFFEILNIFSNFLKYPQRETSLYWRKAFNAQNCAEFIIILTSFRLSGHKRRIA